MVSTSRPRGRSSAENSEVRGCMVIKPWGYGIWEQMRDQLDVHFKATGHVNAYFPLLDSVELPGEGGGTRRRALPRSAPWSLITGWKRKSSLTEP